MSKVALVPCRDYREEAVFGAVEAGMALLGGMSAFIKPGETVLLKPNLLRKATPDQAITTHPTLVAAAARLAKAAGCGQVSWGDSPAGVAGSPKKAAEAAGIGQVAKDLGLAEADFGGGEDTSFPQGYALKKMLLCPGALQADAIINICKMKTHALERITGAVKNMYGCIYGVSKGAGHVLFPSPDTFAEMLVDIQRLLKPRLHIMDGVVAMEGNGPASGTPVNMGVILISEDPVALDTVFCHLIHLNPLLVPTNVKGRAGGIGTWREEEITLLTSEGEMSLSAAAARWGKADFDVTREPVGENLRGRGVATLRTFGPKPVIVSENCIKCGECVKSCPVQGKALHQQPGEVPAFDYSKCIRCFCCQELCPARAINVKG